MVPQPPVDYQAPEIMGVVYTSLLCFMAALTVVWLVTNAIRSNKSWPVFLLVGGLISCLTEPMWDYLGLLWWPANLPGQLGELFGVRVPLLVPAAYIFWSAGAGYVTYQALEKGVDRSTMVRVVLITLFLAILSEFPFTATGTYVYFTDQPFEILGYPLYWAAGNTAVPLAIALSLKYIMPHLSGGSRILFLLLMPACAWGFVYGIIGWPTFVALHANIPEWLEWAAAVITMILGAVMTWEMIKVATPEKSLACSARGADD